MKNLKIILCYDDMADDCVEKINEQLKEVGYKIDFSETDPENYGEVEYEIIELK